MEIFLDSGDLNAIEYWIGTGSIRGITMNPLILGQQGVQHPGAHLKRVIELCRGMPISMQVDGGSQDTIRAQARSYSSLSEDVVIKVPIVDPSGNLLLPVVSDLVSEGIKVNVTACMNAMQGIMAAASGATFVSLFAGRIEDEGGNACTQIEILRRSIDSEGIDSRIIVGSVRQPGVIYPLVASGAHICTVPPNVLNKALDHGNSLRTSREFFSAATR